MKSHHMHSHPPELVLNMNDDELVLRADVGPHVAPCHHPVLEAVARGEGLRFRLGGERRLRGGCPDNWDLHCTVSWRYGIEPGAHDGCIGFRVVLA